MCALCNKLLLLGCDDDVISFAASFVLRLSRSSFGQSECGAGAVTARAPQTASRPAVPPLHYVLHCKLPVI